METRETSKTSLKRPDSGASSATFASSARKLARHQLAPETDRYLVRLGLTGLLDGGSSK